MKKVKSEKKYGPKSLGISGSEEKLSHLFILCLHAALVKLWFGHDIILCYAWFLILISFSYF